MSKHTHGPWEWVVHDHSMATLCGPNSVGDHDGIEGHILSLSPCQACASRAEPKEWKWGRCTTVKKDDARLIAAAPELLECLSDLLTACTAEVNEKGGGGFILARMSDARDTIEKATGKRSR